MQEYFDFLSINVPCSNSSNRDSSSASGDSNRNHNRIQRYSKDCNILVPLAGLVQQQALHDNRHYESSQVSEVEQEHSQQLELMAM